MLQLDLPTTQKQCGGGMVNVLTAQSLLLLIVLLCRTRTFYTNMLISETEHAVSSEEAGISDVAWLFILITFWLESWSQTNSFCKHYWSFMCSILYESVGQSDWYSFKSADETYCFTLCSVITVQSKKDHICTL